jgi:hypothetical protein
MFHGKHFGTIVGLRKRTFGVAKGEAAIWSEQRNALGFIWRFL